MVATQQVAAVESADRAQPCQGVGREQGLIAVGVGGDGGPGNRAGTGSSELRRPQECQVAALLRYRVRVS